MCNSNDFLIKNGILIKYNGAGGNVVIPDGVTSIAWDAFEGCNNVTGVTIPEGVEIIEENTFYHCENLQNISLPESLKKIEGGAFSDSLTGYGHKSHLNIYVRDVSVWQKICTSFIESFLDIDDNDEFLNFFMNAPCYNLYIGGVLAPDISLSSSIPCISKYMFSGCESIRNVTIPEGVKKIGDKMFFGCSNLESITIPESVEAIGDYAFDGCDNLESITIPESVKKIGDCAFVACEKLRTITVIGNGKPFDKDVFGKDAPIELINADKKLHTYFSDKQLASYLLKRAVWSQVNDDIKFAIFRERSGQWFARQLSSVVTKKDIGNFAVLLQSAPTDKPSQEDCSAAARLLKSYSSQLSAATVKKLRDALAQSGSDTQTTTDAAQGSSSSDVCMSLINESKLSGKDITSRLKDYYAITIKNLPELKGKDRKAVDPMVFGWLLVIHEDFPESGWDLSHKHCKPGIKPMAAKVLELIDPASFQKALEELGIDNFVTYIKCKKTNLLYPICRYADEKHLAKLLKKVPALMTGKKAESPSFRVLRMACLSNDSRSAMLFADKYGDLDLYAGMRGTDADTLRDTMLSDFGLDAYGKKVYDLGGTTVSATLQADLTLSLFDTAQNKIVKSIPKKGNDETLVAAASEDFSELKKSIQKVNKNRCDALFADFLSGKAKESKDWQAVYLVNPLLRQIANLLVWKQGKATFTLSGKDAVLSDGTAYAITDNPIRLAHPMEMKPTDITAWQSYFVTNAIKQPFAQIWEPVYNLSDIDKKRYDGIHIPAYRFSKQEKHGISFVFDYNSSNACLTLNDCSLNFNGGTAILEHTLNLQGELILGEFEVKKASRRANHIVSLLDKWTLYSRIIKDDVTVIQQMDGANIAQIMEYIRIAGENNAVNVTAALLEYKNAHFANFDPMDEFVL